MGEEINVQIALMDILQREMQTAWAEVRSHLEHGDIKRAWESLRNYFDKTSALFGEQGPAARIGSGLLNESGEIQNTNQLMKVLKVGTKTAVGGLATTGAARAHQQCSARS